jgi:branched-chain amino acid transport system substrate-binding protein
MSETKSTDSEKLVDYYQKEAKFDILKGRQAYFRSWDHQLVQEAYPFEPKPKDKMKDKWDLMALGTAVPAANQPLEVIYPTKQQNPCTL